MKLTLEPTDQIQFVDGADHRVWRGQSEAGVPVLAWVHMVQPQTHDPAALAAFAAALTPLPPRSGQLRSEQPRRPAVNQSDHDALDDAIERFRAERGEPKFERDRLTALAASGGFLRAREIALTPFRRADFVGVAWPLFRKKLRPATQREFDIALAAARRFGARRADPQEARMNDDNVAFESDAPAPTQLGDTPAAIDALTPAQWRDVHAAPGDKIDASEPPAPQPPAAPPAAKDA